MKRLFLVPVLVLLAAGPLLPARAATKAIDAGDNYFSPRYIVINVGDSVTWTNTGSAKHTVTSFTQDFDSSPGSDPQNNGAQCGGTVLNPDDCLDPGSTFSFAFDKVGTFNYYCKAHGTKDTAPDPTAGAQAQPCGMCAQIVVQAKSSPSPVKRRTPTTKPKTSTSASPSASVSASPSPSVIIPTTNGSPIAAPARGGGGGGGRTTLAVLLILVLSGAGYATWRKFLSPR